MDVWIEREREIPHPKKKKKLNNFIPPPHKISVKINQACSNNDRSKCFKPEIECVMTPVNKVCVFCDRIWCKSSCSINIQQFDIEARLRNCRLLEAQRKEASAGGSGGGGQAGNQNKIWKHCWCALPPERCCISNGGRGIYFEWSVGERTELWVHTQSCSNKPILSSCWVTKRLKEDFIHALLTQRTWTWVATNSRFS